MEEINNISKNMDIYLNRQNKCEDDIHSLSLLSNFYTENNGKNDEEFNHNKDFFLSLNKNPFDDILFNQNSLLDDNKTVDKENSFIMLMEANNKGSFEIPMYIYILFKIIEIMLLKILQ